MNAVVMRTLDLAMPSDVDQDRVQWSYLRYMGTGVEFFASIAALTLLGVFLDGRFGTSPVLTLAFALVGFAAATWNLIRSVARTNSLPYKSDDER